MKTERLRQSFLADAIDMISLGTHSLENDNFSECFKPLPSAALYDSGVLYFLSFAIRHLIIFPIRLLLLTLITLFTIMFLTIGKRVGSEQIVSIAFTVFFRLFSVVLCYRVKHTGTKQEYTGPHVYVANHTTFMDLLLMSSHKFYHACISEGHGGLFGLIFRVIFVKNGSIAFRRSERQDREAVLAKIQAHIWSNKSPLVIFPEGTCVNNKYTVLFQKGAFSLGIPIFPVSIKYKKHLIDPYWNRKIQGFAGHMFYLMTRWSIEAEVHWGDIMLPKDNESAVNFSHRVKNIIAKQAGLRNTLWNGYFKSSPALKDREIFRMAYRNVYRIVQSGTLSNFAIKDREAGRDYLLDENLYSEDESKIKYFGSLSRRSFNNECCKEYLRFKDSKAYS